MKKNQALIIVDVQNDFCPGGSLAVTDGDKIIPVINDLMDKFDPSHVFYTRDWHKLDSPHFKTWPSHCIQHTRGADYHSDLKMLVGGRHIIKGFTDEDDYSGFDGVEWKRGNKLDDILQGLGIETVYVVGLATDYCVKATALAANDLGYEVIVPLNACRAVNLKDTDEAAALAEMQNAGIHLEYEHVR